MGRERRRSIAATAPPRLLTEKHLYQSVEVDTGFVTKIAAGLEEDYLAGSGPGSSRVPDLEDLQNEGLGVLASDWVPLDPTQFSEPRIRIQRFVLHCRPSTRSARSARSYGPSTQCMRACLASDTRQAPASGSSWDTNAKAAKAHQSVSLCGGRA